MTDNNKNANTATENNEVREIKLEPQEIMRLSVFKKDEETAELCYEADRNAKAMVLLQALAKVLDANFNMICVPKILFGGVIEMGFATEEELAELISKNVRDETKGETAH